jgi:hypothetical protein
MPVSRENYWCSRITKFFYVFVKSGYNFVSIRNRERAAWAEIVLDINNYQVRLFVNLNLQRLPQMRPLRDEIKPTSHANS